MKVVKEHYENIRTTDTKRTYELLDDVYGLIVNAYKPLAILTKEPEDLLDSNIMWKVDWRDNKPVAVAIYKNVVNIRKLIMIGHDGSAKGKEKIIDILKSNLTENNGKTWLECNGRVEKIISHFPDVLPIPNELGKYFLATVHKASTILSLDEDGYHYTRMIRGKSSQEIIYANIPQSKIEELKSKLDDDF